MPRTNKVFARVEHDHDLVLGFLEANEYPISWTKDMLSQCLVVRLFDDNETLGFVWGQWVKAGIMTFHVCMTPWNRGRWLKPAVLDELQRIAFWVGADHLVASTTDLPNGHIMARLLRRHGFEEDNDLLDRTILLKNLWETYG